MSQTVQYQKYTIRSFPEQSPYDGSWTPKISIAWEENGALTFKRFLAETTHQTESEADNHGIMFGERIIDGKMPGLSVN